MYAEFNSEMKTSINTRLVYQTDVRPMFRIVLEKIDFFKNRKYIL